MKPIKIINDKKIWNIVIRSGYDITKVVTAANHNIWEVLEDSIYLGYVTDGLDDETRAYL